jgi:transposase-like protein
MNANDIQQASTPDADICGGLRTKCGQVEPVEIVSPLVTRRVEAMESGKTIIGGMRMGKTEAMRIMMARDATEPAPAAVEECPNCNNELQVGENIHRCDRCGRDCCSHCSTIHGLCDDCHNVSPAELTPKRLTPEMVTHTPPADRPTPITDDAKFTVAHEVWDGKRGFEEEDVDVVPSEISEDLERQLAEAREIIALYRESKASLPEYSSQRELRRQLSEVTAQRDTLETALKDIAEGNMFPRNRARLALAAVKGADAADSSAPVSKKLDTI